MVSNHDMDASVASRMSFHYDRDDGSATNTKVPLAKIAAGVAVVLVALGAGLGVGVAINKSKEPDPTLPPTTSAPTTSAPTEAPIPPEILLLEELLPDFSMAVIQTDPDSPQSKAYDWILEELSDGLYMDATADPDRILQRFALATFYYATEGDEWFNNDGWLDHSLHECLWFGKPWFSYVPYEGFDARFYFNDNPNSCEWPTLNPNVTYEGSQTYKHFWLYEQGLRGTIPPELSLLTGVVSMYLYNNFYAGQLPSQIGLMNNLRVLNIGVNELSGTLPTQLGMMYSLRGVSIFGTGIGGPIPSQLGLLTQLSTLKIDENRLTSTIPTVLGRLSGVHELWLSRNLLSGPIPSELGQFQPLERRGSDFILFENLLSGPIPSQIGLITGRMDYFWLNNNQLSGSLPTELGQLAGTKDFVLDNNQLSGSLPSELGLCTSVLRLDLHNNKIKGSIPSELGLLPSLAFFYLHDNELTGTIPSELPNLSPVTPWWIGRYWDSLTWLFELEVELYPLPPLVFAVQNNQLSGTISNNFALVENLGSVQLTNNPLLSGTIPDRLCNLTVWPAFQEEAMFDCTDSLCGCNCTCSALDP